MQQGDVKLFQTLDGGDITVAAGIVDMSGGLETAAYLSLFGGNEEDSGSDSNPLTWWGNLDELDTADQFRSETQFLLDGLPATPNNLLRIEDAASRDLKWFLDKRVASSITVIASIPTSNQIKLIINIEAEGEETSFEFVENWKATV